MLPPDDYSEMRAALQHRVLRIALNLAGAIELAQTKKTAEYPTELLKLLGPIVKVADDLNGLSLASSIDRVVQAGYTVTEGEDD